MTQSYKKYILITLILLIIPIVNATDYYFSPSGNDSLDGLTNATAWLSLSKLTSIPFTGGETVCFNGGDYNTVAQREMYLTNITSDVIFKPCSPGQKVNLTNYASAYAVVPNSLWTNISYQGINVWTTTYASLSTSNPIIQFSNGTEFINSECWNTTLGTCDTTYYDFATKYNNSFYRVWANDTSNEIRIIMANGENPNNIPLYIAEEYSMFRFRNVNNTGKLIITGLNFQKHRRALEFSYSNNLLIYNNTFDEGLDSILFRYGTTSTRNITITNNTFIGHHQGLFYNDFIKGAYEESDPIRIDPSASTDKFYQPFIITNNYFNETVAGISLVTDTPATMCNSYIANNYFNFARAGGYESTFEIEQYCCNSTWRNNTQIGGQLAGLSLGPANSSTGTCHFVYNKIIMNDTIYQNSSTTYNTYAVKAYDKTGDGILVTDWNISHNTFIAKGRAWWSGLEIPTEMKRNTIINNIFISNTDEFYEVIQGTGTDANGNFWNYNSYYQMGNGKLLKTWMNDSSTTEYSTLASARASSVWDGEWDLNSIDTNPLLDFSTFIPSNNSPVCGSASDGNDIGALACELSPTPTPTPSPSPGCDNNVGHLMGNAILTMFILGVLVFFAYGFYTGSLDAKSVLVIVVGGIILLIGVLIIKGILSNICGI